MFLIHLDSPSGWIIKKILQLQACSWLCTFHTLRTVHLKALKESHQGLVNVPLEHHPTIGDIISNRYLKVMWNKSPKRDINPNPCTLTQFSPGLMMDYCCTLLDLDFSLIPPGISIRSVTALSSSLHTCVNPKWIYICTLHTLEWVCLKLTDLTLFFCMNCGCCGLHHLLRQWKKKISAATRVIQLSFTYSIL